MSPPPRSSPSGPLRIVYAKLSDAALWDDNPKRHDVGGIMASIRQHGFRDAPIYDHTLGAIVAGNGRASVLAEMQAQGRTERDEAWPPAGVVEDATGEWWLPLQVGIDAPTREEAEAFGVDHNVLTLGGSGLEFAQVAGLFDRERLEEVLSRSRSHVAGIAQADVERMLNPPPPPGGRQFDEAAADGLPTLTCPHCEHVFPR